MSKKIFVGGLDKAKTAEELIQGLKAKLISDPPNGLGIKTGIDGVEVVIDRDTGDRKGFGFIKVADDATATRVKTLNGQPAAGIATGNLTVNDARDRDDDDRGGRDRDRDRDRDDRRGRDRDRDERPPRREPTTAAPTTPTPRATTTRGWSCGQKILAGLVGLLVLGAIALAIVLPLALCGGGTKDEEARQGLVRVNARIDGLSTKMDDSKNEILEQLKELRKDNHMDVPPAPVPAPTPTPAPVPPVPAPAPAPAPAPTHVDHHPADDGGHHYSGSGAGQRTRNDEQDARLAALEARATANERHDAEQDRQIAEQARIQQVLVEWNGADACRRSDARSRQGCQYLEAQFGRQFE